MRFKLGCSLGYEVQSPTTFIFNVEVAQLQSLEVKSETLALSPNLQRETYVSPDLRNRYIGVNVQPGPFALEYNAEVDLAVHRADPAGISETPLSALPIAILPFLLPSRSVSSDRLTPFAQAEFGHLAKGHKRV